MEAKQEKYFNNWLKQHRSGIPFSNLMNELLDYGKNKKAQFTYNKCVRNRKFNLAEKIAKKYNLKTIQSDGVMSMQIAMMALKSKKDE